MGILNSGWCLNKYNEFTKAQHDKCPKNFTANSCPCDCGHAGEKPKGWNSGYAVVGPTEKALIEKEDAETNTQPLLKVDTPAQGVYAVETVPEPRKSAEGAKEALQALYK